MHIQSYTCLKKLVLITVLLTAVLTMNAQETKEKGKHHEDHYHLSGFAGYTSDYKGRVGYKLGLEYEWRISDPVGIGGTFDFTGADFRIFAFSVGTTLYPFKKIPLVFGAGVGAKNDHKKWKEFFRFLVVYDFHLNNFTIGPMYMWDLFPGQKDIFSLGVTVGFSLH